MKIKVVGVRFEFHFLGIMIYAILLTLLISLGVWQLGRAEQKRDFLEQKKQSFSEQNIKISTAIESNIEAIRYRKTGLTGSYDQQHQFLIDNQIKNGKPGYFVLTPLQFIEESGKAQAVLVNRGWVPLIKDRRVLPDLSISEKEADISGRINFFPAVGMKLKGAEIPTSGWPSVVQVVDAEVLSDKLGYVVLPFQIELDPEMSEGYKREWKTDKMMPPEKHIAYATQWFGLAITLTLLMIWISRKIDE